MQKNVAGQKIGAQLVSATDGSAFTGSVTVEVTIDAGTQATGSVGSGACAHEGNGYHTYAPAQAETNGTLIAFTFHGTGAVPVTVQVFATGYDPTAAQLPTNLTQWLGTAPLALSSQQVQAVVPATQKVDVETIKTRAVTAAGAVAVGGFVGQDTAAIGVNGSGHVSRVVLVDTATTLTNAPADSSGTTTLLSRLSALRAGYLDNLSAGAVALEASLQALITTIGASAAGVATAVWAAGTRLLTAGTNIVLAKGVGVTGFNDLSAAQVNAEADTALSDIGATSTRMGYLDNLSAGAVALASSLTTLAGKFTGITLLAEWLGLIAGKQTGNSTARTELRATGAGSGTYDETADSQEALRDRGDAAWADSGTPPTAAAIATQVRTELTTELGRVDVAVSSRLATAGYTAPPSAATNASAVRTELTTELGRIDAAVSSRATPTQVSTELATYDGPTKAELDAAVAALATSAALSTAQTAISAIKVITDALTAAAAAKLAASALGLITGTIDTAGFAPTTTQFEADDITEATADHYNGRIITFTSGVLLGQSTDIADYALATGRGHFTVTALTEAPGNNDTFVIT